MSTSELEQAELRQDTKSSSFSTNLKAALDLSTAATQSDENTDNRFFYSAGSQMFLLENDLKAETLKQANINKVPYMPAWHKGIISIRGIIMPVIDIHAFVQQQLNDTKPDQNEKKYLLKLEHKHHSPIVFIVDKLPVVINIKNLKKTKKTKNTPAWVTGYLKQGSTKIAQINHNELLQQIITTQ